MMNGFEDNKIKYLVLAVFFLSLIILIKEIILKPRASLEILQISSISFSKKNQIDFELLKNFRTQNFSPFYEISLPKEKGRENPFVEY